MSASEYPGSCSLISSAKSRKGGTVNDNPSSCSSSRYARISITKLKSIGARMEPWKTPRCRAMGLDRCGPATREERQLETIRECISLMMAGGTLRDINAPIMAPCRTRSNALDKSRKTLSRELKGFGNEAASWHRVICVVVPYPCRNPAWNL